MLVYNLEQGTPEWLRLRLGVITTSNFGKIITPGGKKSGQWEDYMDSLLGQLLTGQLEDFYKSPAMERGNELEPQAADYYAHFTGAQPREIGFVTTRDGRIGCSPDRLVGHYGLLEIKCPLQKTHAKNLRTGTVDMKYYPQVQGQMLLTKRKWCDWMSYHPDAPASIVRIERDEEYLDKLKVYLNEVLTEMDHVIDMWERRGIPLAVQVKPREIGNVEGV